MEAKDKKQVKKIERPKNKPQKKEVIKNVENIETKKRKTTKNKNIIESANSPRKVDSAYYNEKVISILPEENERATKLCYWIIACFVAFAIPMAALYAIEDTESAIYNVATILSTFALVTPFVGVGLLVYVRTRYPFNKLGNILMWIIAIGVMIAITLYFIYVFRCGGNVVTCTI